MKQTNKLKEELKLIEQLLETVNSEAEWMQLTRRKVEIQKELDIIITK